MWTEHAPQEEAQQKIFPRLIALGEVLWTYPSKKDYVNFEKRLRSQFPMMDAWGIKYGFISTPVRVDATAADGRLYAEVKQEDPLVSASYRLLSSDPAAASKTPVAWEKINGPIEIKGNQELVVQVQTQGSQQVSYIHRNYSHHLAMGKYIELNYKINSNYPGGGDYGLVDGRLGTTNFRDGIWQAVQGQDMEMVIDLGSLMSFNRISTHWFHYTNAWIFRPETVSYFASVDGNHWTLLKDVKAEIPIQAGGEAAHASVCEQAYPAYMGRYVKVVAKTIGKCPAWHDAAGEPSWLFCDEIIVE
jgi:hexosaminidase